MNKPFYPSKIKVDEIFNPFTGKQEQILISTGPYRKELAGDTEESVRKYLAYLVDRYQEDKKKYMEMRKSQMEAKINKSEREKQEDKIILDKVKPLFDNQLEETK